MFNMILEALFGFIMIQGICSKSMQNVTIDDSKFVTTDMLENWKKNMTDWITDALDHSQKSKDHVFFYAMMPAADITLNKNSIVKFSEVSNNEGNHFNSGDSVFVSPVSGVYLFSWTTTTTSSKTTNTELRVNNVRIETLHSAVGGTGAISVTKVIITNVKKNDHVWIQTSGFYTDNYFDYNYNSRSSFMGFLMYET